MVENPLLALHERIVRRCGEVLDPVNEPGDSVWLPINRKDVVVVRDRRVQVIGIPIALPTRITRTMQGPKDFIGHASDKFHDVNLTGLRPADLVNIRAEHPERRPQARALRYLDPRFDTAIRYLEAILGEEPRR